MKTFKDLVELIGLYDFVDSKDWQTLVGVELVSDNSNISHDSYGSENSTLEYVYHHTPTNTFWKISGTRESYNGTEFDGVKQVYPTTKQITSYEETNG